MQQRVSIADRTESESVRRRQCHHHVAIWPLTSDALSTHKNRRRSARRMATDPDPSYTGSQREPPQACRVPPSNSTSLRTGALACVNDELRERQTVRIRAAGCLRSPPRAHRRSSPRGRRKEPQP
jgi:hypothetical protein